MTGMDSCYLTSKLLVFPCAETAVQWERLTQMGSESLSYLPRVTWATHSPLNAWVFVAPRGSDSTPQKQHKDQSDTLHARAKVAPAPWLLLSLSFFF